VPRRTGSPGAHVSTYVRGLILPYCLTLAESDYEPLDLVQAKTPPGADTYRPRFERPEPPRRAHTNHHHVCKGSWCPMGAPQAARRVS